MAKIIESLKTKSSCGDDGLSTKLLKEIKNEICSSITLIVNQMITTGIFPDSLKIAKIIPIFKKGDIEIIENYRQISKIFQKYSKRFCLCKYTNTFSPNTYTMNINTVS